MPITCRDIPARASAWIDRETPLAERVAVGWHLASCPDCRRYVRSLRITRSLIAASMVVGDIPDALRGRLGLDSDRTQEDGSA